MAKEPASLAAVVRKPQTSEPEQSKQRAPKQKTAPTKPAQEKDLGPDRRLSFACSARLYLDLQIHKAHTGMNHQDIIADALAEYLKKHAKERQG